MAAPFASLPTVLGARSDGIVVVVIVRVGYMGNPGMVR